MNLKATPELLQFLSLLMDSDMEQDEVFVSRNLSTLSSGRFELIHKQLRDHLKSDQLPVEEFGEYANRWFEGDADAREWLDMISLCFEQKSRDGGAVSKKAVLDSNGTPLLEGDSVTVIKDLKVKGGNSDLKRGTLVKKIHLIDDTEAIECRIDGSVLVLKTCFLKKA